MNAPTDTATLQEPTDRAEIHGDGTVIVEYTKTEAALADLRARYKGVAFDLTTTRGDKEARAARLELVTLRTSLEKRRKTFKAPAIAFGKKIDAEAERITAEIEALEKPIDEQIRADEARREAEKEAKRQAEAARVAKHENAIATINLYVRLAQGLPSDRISGGIAKLQAMEFGPEWEEFHEDAREARDRSIMALQSLYATTLAREEEAQRLEAQRLEQERVAAELAKQKAELDRQRAELERQQREIIEAAEAERAEQAARQEKARTDGIAAIQQEARRTFTEPTVNAATTMDVAIANPPFDPGPGAIGGPMRENTTAPPSEPEPTIKLGEISQRLGFTLTEVFIRETLHIEPCGNDKRAVLFKASDFARICAALINHLGRLA